MEGTPVLFYAIADFHSDEPGDLSFKAKQIIAVTDQGEGVESWWCVAGGNRAEQQEKGDSWKAAKKRKTKPEAACLSLRALFAFSRVRTAATIAYGVLFELLWWPRERRENARKAKQSRPRTSESEENARIRFAPAALRSRRLQPVGCARLIRGAAAERHTEGEGERERGAMERRREEKHYSEKK